jgi:hypothetical protein
MSAPQSPVLFHTVLHPDLHDSCDLLPFCGQTLSAFLT